MWVWNDIESWNAGRQDLGVHRTQCHTELTQCSISQDVCLCSSSPYWIWGENKRPRANIYPVLVNCFYSCKHKEGAVVCVSALGATLELGQICFLNCFSCCFERTLVVVTTWLWHNSGNTFMGVVWNGVSLFFFTSAQLLMCKWTGTRSGLYFTPIFSKTLWFDCCSRYKMGCSSLCHL